MEAPRDAALTPEHADCNVGYFRKSGTGPQGVVPLDPEAARYAPPVTIVDGVEHRWWLVDVEEENRKHPETFFLAAATRRRQLSVGDSARLIFRFTPRGEDEPSGERMWVAVAGADAQGYVGYLTNEPVFIEGLDAGDVIGFEPRHVASVEVTDDDLGFNVEARAFVSLRVGEGAWPTYVHRSPESDRRPPRRDAYGWELVDSGWSVLTGDETDEELDNADFILLWQLGWLVERCPSVRPLVESGAPSGEWIWHPQRGAYERLA